MKILILSPLFPPDTAPSAQYVKELAARLTNHEVTVLLYGHLPEAVPNVQYVCVDKRSSKFMLIFKSVFALIKNGKQSDLIIVNNGPSAELPAWLCSFFVFTPMTLCISDTLAAKASRHGLNSLIHKLCAKRMTSIVTLPSDRKIYLPKEILPFETLDSFAEAEQSLWWENHIKNITRYDK